MASSIQLLRSTKVQERPFPGNLLEGQPAANLNSAEPGLFFKTSDGSLVKIGPVAITSDGSPPNASAIGLAGNSVGEMWLDKSVDSPVLKIYDGAEWVDAGSGNGGGSAIVTLQRWMKTAGGGETSLSGPDNSSQILSYTPELEEVFLNGVMLTRGVDYTANSGDSIILAAPLASGDEVTVLGWKPFNVLGEIDGSNIVNGTVSEIKLADGAVSEVKLANDAVTSDKIADESITDIHVSPSAGITASKLSFTQTGASAPRTIDSKLKDVVSVKDFGAAGDGETNDADAIESAINSALATGRTVFFPPGEYNVATRKEFSFTGNLTLVGDNATLLLSGGVFYTLGFRAPSAASTTLDADVGDGSYTITVASTSGIVAGQLIRLSTNTLVATNRPYVKRSTLLVSGVSGNTIILSEPLNFGFTVAETQVTTYAPASLRMDGVSIKQVGGQYRFDIVSLQNCSLKNATITGYQEFNGDVIYIGGVCGLTGQNLNLIKGRYTINATASSRNLYFEDIYAKDCRHPIDCNTWTFNTRIKRLTGINTQGSIQSHACFEVHFEDCTDITQNSGGIGLRCFGGSARRVRVSNLTGSQIEDVQRVFPLPEYEYLIEKYDRVYEEIDSPTAILTAGAVKTLIVRNCKVPSIFLDGSSAQVSNVSIDTETKTTSRMSLRRVRILSPDGEVFIDDPPESFASLNAIKDIIGITNSNPAVVTCTAHGFSDGDLVRINGVVGMTEVNEKVFTVANALTNTFELSGEDSTAYSPYGSGGKSTLGRLAKTIDPLLTPGLGYYPNFRVKMLLRRTGAILSPNTSLTIPVKVKSVYGIQEAPLRNAVITIRASSSSRGDVIAAYQVRMFAGSTSSSSISAQQLVVPSIGTLTATVSNFRHHFYTQVAAEGGDPNTNIGEYYYSFDTIVTASSTNDKVQYIDVAVDEVRAPFN